MNKENFSEEKRKLFIGNKRTIILSISLIVAIVFSGILGVSFVLTVDKYDELYIDYLELLNEFNELDNQYFILTGEHIELEGDYTNLLDEYDNLQNIYNTLSNAYNYVCNTINQTILPVQFSIFAEAVRRYYLPIYLDNTTTKSWYMGYVEFCRDIILHDSMQYNAFSEVSDAFSDALRFGSDTIGLANYIMEWTFDYCDTINYWGLDELAGTNNLTVMDIVIQECIDEFDYEYDSDIIIGQESPTWDYPKFPVETAFRTMGDCEDQAILTAAYLESCGFETAISIFHDPEHPTYGAFYHGVPLIHIEDTDAFWSNYPSCSLWRLGYGDPYYPDYTWCYLDPTGDVPFGSTPDWLQDYIDIGSISGDIHSTAFCDIDGNIQENIGLTYIIPT